MKYLIPLLLVSTVAVAQESPPPRCAPADKIIQYLQKDYEKYQEEKPKTPM